MKYQPAFMASPRAILLVGLLAFVLLFAGSWAWTYGHPVFSNADFTTVEDMYRDVVIGSGSLWDWRLPRSSYYLDVFLYFAVRGIGGDIHNGLALFAAAQACFVVAGACCALTSVRPPRIWQTPLVALLYSLALHGQSQVSEHWLPGNMAHVLTLGAVLWGLGLFLRVLGKERGGQSFRMGWTGWWLLLLVTSMTLCDFIFVLWFVFPALAVLAWCWLRARRGERQAFVFLGLALCLAVSLGKALDGLSRAYPAAGMGSFKPQDMLSSLLVLVGRTVDIAGQVPLLAVFWSVGLCALLGGGYLSRNAHRALNGEFALFVLCSMAFNVVALASFSMSVAYYYLMFYYLPLLLGFPLLLTIMDESLAQRQRKENRYFFFPTALPLLLVFSCLGLLALSTVSDVLERKAPYSPPLARCFDRLVQSRADSFSLLASYWNIHDRFFTKNANIQAKHVFKSLLPYELNTNPTTQPKLCSGILVSPGGYWEGIDTELARRLNGEPDEVFACPEAGKDYEIWLYKNGARPLSPEDALFDGKRLVPEQAKDDILLWQGRRSFANGLTLTRVWSALRWDERWCVLEFADAPETVAVKADTAKMALGVTFIGDRSPSHRRKAAARLAANPDGAFAPLYRLFLHDRTWDTAENPVYALPNGGSAVFFGIPSRHSTAWPFFEVSVGQERFKLR